MLLRINSADVRTTFSPSNCAVKSWTDDYKYIVYIVSSQKVTCSNSIMGYDFLLGNVSLVLVISLYGNGTHASF